MTIKQFIEKAIEGGWKVRNITPTLISIDNTIDDMAEFETPHETRLDISLFEILLDPKAWKAVGKVEGWNDENKLSRARRMGWSSTPRAKMHQMIDVLADGKSLEEYLETL